MKNAQGYTFACDNKRIQGGYLVSSYFKDIYLYLAQNKLPGNKMAIKKVEALAEKIYFTKFIII